MGCDKFKHPCRPTLSVRRGLSGLGTFRVLIDHCGSKRSVGEDRGHLFPGKDSETSAVGRLAMAVSTNGSLSLATSVATSVTRANVGACRPHSLQVSGTSLIKKHAPKMQWQKKNHGQELESTVYRMPA